MLSKLIFVSVSAVEELDISEVSFPLPWKKNDHLRRMILLGTIGILLTGGLGWVGEGGLGLGM